MTVSAKPGCFMTKPQYRRIVLLALWCLGLVFGCSIYEPSYLSWMHGAAERPVSIIGVFVCVYLPLICTYFSFLTDKPHAIMVVCFVKAASFGFSGQLVLQYFTSSGWLVRFLFLFSDCFILLILQVLWIHCLDGNSKKWKRDFLIAAILCTVVTMIDLFAVIPFLKGLL